MTEEETSFQLEDQSTDFSKEPIYTREQVDQLLLEGHTDSAIGLEYFLDEQGKTRVRKKRLPVPNIFTTDISTSHLSIEDKRIITDLLELANDLVYHSKALAKFSKPKKVLINAYKIQANNSVYLYKGFDRKTQKPILEERKVEEDIPVMIEREVPQDIFNLNPAIEYFLNEAVALAHVSKGVDGNAARLSHHQSISETASKFNYDLEKERIQETLPEEQKKDSFNLDGVQNWATHQSKKKPF